MKPPTNMTRIVNRTRYDVSKAELLAGDDYWDGYRSAIRSVTPAQAHEAARTYIQPDRALIVAVGRAADIVEPLRRYGPVRVVDTEGHVVSTFEALPADTATTPAPPSTQTTEEAAAE